MASIRKNGASFPAVAVVEMKRQGPPLPSAPAALPFVVVRSIDSSCCAAARSAADMALRSLEQRSPDDSAGTTNTLPLEARVTSKTNLVAGPVNEKSKVQRRGDSLRLR